MFRIKKEQMDHFAANTRRRFEDKTAAYLRAEHGQRVAHLKGDALAEWVHAAVDKASRFGVGTEPEATQLLLLLLLLGLDADERLPWAREVLTNRDLVALGKVRRLVRRARQHDVAGLDDVLVYEEMSDRRLSPAPVQQEEA
jgi:hypothetical protein